MSAKPTNKKAGSSDSPDLFSIAGVPIPVESPEIPKPAEASSSPSNPQVEVDGVDETFTCSMCNNGGYCPEHMNRQSYTGNPQKSLNIELPLDPEILEINKLLQLIQSERRLRIEVEKPCSLEEAKAILKGEWFEEQNP